MPGASGFAAFPLLQVALQTPGQRSRPLLSISVSQDDENSFHPPWGKNYSCRMPLRACPVALGSWKGNSGRLGWVLACFPSLPWVTTRETQGSRNINGAWDFLLVHEHWNYYSWRIVWVNAVLGYLLHIYSPYINIWQQLHLVMLLEIRIIPPPWVYKRTFSTLRPPISEPIIPM